MSDSGFARRVHDAVADGSFAGLVLSRPARADLPPRRDLRLFAGKDGPRLQWSWRDGRQELHDTVDVAAGIDGLRALFPAAYREANLRTTGADVIGMASRKGRVRVTERPAERGPATPALPAGHDRAKTRLLDPAAPFLAAVGISGADGRVQARKQDKFRQIARYLELVDDVLPALPADGTLRVVDCGCGKSALTFALHHLLVAVRGRTVELLGLDANPQVLASCTATAERLALPGLRFRPGTIAGHEEAGTVHLVVSLHACDTATDEALAQAVRWKADAILAVPCCQHELDRRWRQGGLEPLRAHGILRERFAALATDALRADALEAAGYRTQAVEFVDVEHTPKNVLLRATRDRDDPARRARFAARYAATKAHLGIDTMATDAVLKAAP